MVRLVTIALLLIPLLGFAQPNKSHCDQLGYYNCIDEKIMFQEKDLNSFDEIEFTNRLLSIEQIDLNKLKVVKESVIVRNLGNILNKILGQSDTSHVQSSAGMSDILAVGKISSQTYTTLIFAQDKSNSAEGYSARLLYIATLSKLGQLRSVVTVSDALGVMGSIQASSLTVKKQEHFTRTLKFQEVNDVIGKGVKKSKETKGDRVIKFRLTPEGFVEIIRCTPI